MRPISAILLLLALALGACTIREETFAPRGEESADGLSLTAPGSRAPTGDDTASCPGGYARGSDVQTYRDGTQDLFCD